MTQQFYSFLYWNPTQIRVFWGGILHFAWVYNLLRSRRTISINITSRFSCCCPAYTNQPTNQRSNRGRKSTVLSLYSHSRVYRFAGSV